MVNINYFRKLINRWYIMERKTNKFQSDVAVADAI